MRAQYGEKMGGGGGGYHYGPLFQYLNKNKNILGGLGVIQPLISPIFKIVLQKINGF